MIEFTKYVELNSSCTSEDDWKKQESKIREDMVDTHNYIYEKMLGKNLLEIKLFLRQLKVQLDYWLDVVDEAIEKTGENR
jgi:hypothetical protein